jgi:hypothetical protein
MVMAAGMARGHQSSYGGFRMPGLVDFGQDDAAKWEFTVSLPPMLYSPVIC